MESAAKQGYEQNRGRTKELNGKVQGNLEKQDKMNTEIHAKITKVEEINGVQNERLGSLHTKCESLESQQKWIVVVLGVAALIWGLRKVFGKKKEDDEMEHEGKEKNGDRRHARQWSITEDDDSDDES